MRKYFCDRCGRETAMFYLVKFQKLVDGHIIAVQREICPVCEKSFTEWWKVSNDEAESEVSK